LSLTTIEAAKETGLVQANVLAAPLILVQIVAVDGDIVNFASTPATGSNTLVYNGNTYQCRLIDSAIEAILAQSAQGYDIPGSVNLKIDDSDFTIWSNHANAHQWRGGTITITFILWDLPSNSFTTNSYIWTFICGKPNIDSAGVLTVEGQARQSMTRLNVPNFARQNRCGNTFPSTAAQRLDGLTNPTSPSYGCGYSPDLISIGGIGNTTTANLTSPDGSPLTDSSGNYLTCDLTRSCGAGKGTLTQGCMARLGNYSGTLAPDGDITKDHAAHPTARFTGDTWNAPPGWSGRQYTNPSAGTQYGFNTPNPATGGTYYPIVYGTQWVNATVLAPVGNVNQNKVEAVVCMCLVGSASVQKVLVGGTEVTQNNSDSSFTYYLRSAGGRQGAVDADTGYNSQGDPHGSMCYIEIVVPVQLSAAGSLPQIQVLVTGPPPLHAYPIGSASISGAATILTLPAGIASPDIGYGMQIYVKGNSGVPDGAYTVTGVPTGGPPGTIPIPGTWTGTGGSIFYFPNSTSSGGSANPVWALMDLLAMWGPFTVGDFDTLTWYNAAQICDAQITYSDINGNSATHERYRCSMALTGENRQSLAKAVLGLRNCAGLILGRNPSNGLLQVYVEQTLADQQPAPISGSNYNTAVASTTAAGVAANGYLAYLFDGNGSIEKGTFKLGGRSINDTPNTVSFPFQDGANQWVEDSITTIDPLAYTGSGNQEIVVPLQILGIENFDQGTRRSNIEVAKANYGNSRFDAGGTDLINIRAGVGAAHLASRVGYMCGIRYDQLSV